MNPIESVREGMDVFDASGDRVGKVANVKMGDPEARTAQGQQPEPTGGILGAIVSVFDGSPDLPEERKERLLRLEYIEIDTPGIGYHHYESAQAIDRVDSEGVFLRATAASARN